MFDWITSLVQQTGYAGIALLMLAENIFPPIPSELIMPLAGFSAARGQLNLILVIVSGTIGSVAGALFWYYIGRWVGFDRLRRWSARNGRWLTLAPQDLDKAQGTFIRHRGIAIFFGRLIPAIRTLISVPAGITKMPMPRFLFWTTLGTSIWSGLLVAAGYLLQSQHHLVADYVNPVSNVVVGALLVWYIVRVITFRADID